MMKSDLKFNLKSAAESYGFKLDEDIKESWVQALRSGRYEGGRGRLAHTGVFCCLGVLRAESGFVCNFSRYGDPEDIALDEGRLDYSIIPRGVQDQLIQLNDVQKLPFSEIADLIEKCL